MELITSTIPFSLRKQWSSRQKTNNKKDIQMTSLQLPLDSMNFLIAITSPNLGQTILFSRGWGEGWNHFCSLIVFFCFLIASFGKWKEFTLALSKVSSTFHELKIISNQPACLWKRYSLTLKKYINLISFVSPCNANWTVCCFFWKRKTTFSTRS